MRALLDTNVLVELVKPNGEPKVLATLQQISGPNLYLSDLTVGEIIKGIALLAPGAKQANLSNWLNGIQVDFADRILPIDLEIARIWGELLARSRQRGITIPPTDGLIAATALRHSMTIVTRNTRDFAATGAILVDPWQD